MNSLKKNFIYNTLYQILYISVPLITTPFLSREIGPDGVGRYSYCYSIAYYFVIFAMLGINNHASRTIAGVRDDKRALTKTFWSIYYFQLCTALLSTSIYVLYAVFISDERELAILMIFYVLSAGIDVNWFFAGLENFKFTTIRNLIIKIISVILILSLVHGERGLYTYCLIFALGIFVSNIVVWPKVIQTVGFDRVKLSDIHKHIMPIFVMFIPIIAISLYKYMDKIMLGLMSEKTEVGFYESCERIAQLPVVLVNSLGTIMMPRIAYLINKNAEEDSRKYFSKSIAFAMFLAASMSFGIMGVSKEFVPLFYGAGFEPCVRLFQYVTPSCIFMAFANVVRTQYLIPYQKDKVYIISVISGAVINLILNAAFIPSLGAGGAAIATLFAEASVCIVQVVWVRKQLDLKKYVGISMPFLIAGIIMYVLLLKFPIVVSSPILNLSIKIAFGAVVYFICILLAASLCLIMRKIKRN